MPLVTRTTTQGNIFKQDTEPDDKTTGSLWVDTSVDAPALSVGDGTNYVPIQVALRNNGASPIPIEGMV